MYPPANRTFETLIPERAVVAKASWRVCFLTMLLVSMGTLALHVPGCVCGDAWYGFSVHGRFLSSDTQEPLTDVLYGGRLLVGGEEIDSTPAIIMGGSANYPPPAEDGSFALGFVEAHVGQCGLFFLLDLSRPELTRPDEVEVIIVRDACEQTIRIEITEETVVDFDFPGDVIELSDPVLVPPCDQGL